MTFFDFGRANHLGITRVVSDDDLDQQVEWWLSGRIFGININVSILWQKRLDQGRRGGQR